MTQGNYDTALHHPQLYQFPRVQHKQKSVKDDFEPAFNAGHMEYI